MAYWMHIYIVYSVNIQLIHKSNDWIAVNWIESNWERNARIHTNTQVKLKPKTRFFFYFALIFSLSLSFCWTQREMGKSTIIIIVVCNVIEIETTFKSNNAIVNIWWCTSAHKRATHRNNRLASVSVLFCLWLCSFIYLNVFGRICCHCYHCWFENRIVVVAVAVVVVFVVYIQSQRWFVPLAYQKHQDMVEFALENVSIEFKHISRNTNNSTVSISWCEHCSYLYTLLSSKRTHKHTHNVMHLPKRILHFAQFVRFAHIHLFAACN